MRNRAQCLFSTILSKHRMAPVCSMPQRMVCSPIRSDLTSAMKDDCNTPARVATGAGGVGLGQFRPSPGVVFRMNRYQGGAPRNRACTLANLSARALGATMMTVISSRIFMPSSTMLKPCE